MEKKIIPFKYEEVNEILNKITKKSQNEIVKDVITPLSESLERLKEKYAGLLLLPGIPSVTIRNETLQILLECFEMEMPDRYGSALKNAGRAIGRSFSTDFIKTLQKVTSVPKDLGALLHLWLKLEERAGWGKFKIEEFKKDKLIIMVSDFFLAKGLPEERMHRNSPFMEGYIEGFLWVTTKFCSRWLQDQYGVSYIDSFPEPTSVKSEPFGNNYKYNIFLKKEELIEAFNELYKAKKSHFEGHYTDVAVSVRVALEKGFKSKIGIELEKQVSIGSIMKSFKEYLIAPSYRVIKDAYGKSSAIIHGTLRPTKESSNVLINDCEEALRELELTSLKEEEKKKIREIAFGGS